jgi:RAB protein geranylgeranyltransferase component A
MEDSTPTHFNIILLGTGLISSILAGGLAKTGFTVLQLDLNSFYGDEEASLNLDELISLYNLDLDLDNNIKNLDNQELLKLSKKFNLSLSPNLIPAQSNSIQLLIKSKVAAYLSFGSLQGIALVTASSSSSSSSSSPSDSVTAQRIPASKADVFNHPTLSLIEKRRLTKLLLFAAGDQVLETTSFLSGIIPFSRCMDCIEDHTKVQSIQRSDYNV